MSADLTVRGGRPPSPSPGPLSDPPDEGGAPRIADGLPAAIVRLAAAARDWGVSGPAAAEEARVLSAAIAEPNRGAYLDWCAAWGLPADAGAFMDAVTRGRRYRAAPTPLAATALAHDTPPARAYAAALADVCVAAALLGEPTPSSLDAAQTAAAAQLGQSSPGSLAGNVSDDDERARRDFDRNAPAILADVLSRLSDSQQNLLDLSQPGGLEDGSSGPDSSNSDGERLGQTNRPQVLPPAQPPQPVKTVDEWLAELDALTGLAQVKAEIHRQTAILRVDALRTKAGLKSPTITRHLVFTGNPGTGKTTVARMVAGIYQAIGLLSQGQLVEVDRSELVAGYLGQTAIKTAEVVAKAIGGVLFVDEAYSLSGDQYGEEAINTLVKEMEDHRDDLVVIVAGYPAPMAVFIEENPGLASRFRSTIEFADYTDDELCSIFSSMAAQSDYDLADGCLDEFVRLLARQPRDESFGNGRFARNTLEEAIGRHAWRLREVPDPSVDELRTLLPADISGTETP